MRAIFVRSEPGARVVYNQRKMKEGGDLQMPKEIFSVMAKNGTIIGKGLTLAAAKKAANTEAKKHVVSFAVKNEKGQKVYEVWTVLAVE